MIRQKISLFANLLYNVQISPVIFDETNVNNAQLSDPKPKLIPSKEFLDLFPFFLDIHTQKQQNDPHITAVNRKLTAGQYNCQLCDAIKVRLCVHYVQCRQTSIQQLTFFNRKYCLLSSSALNDLNANSNRWLKFVSVFSSMIRVGTFRMKYSCFT